MELNDRLDLFQKMILSCHNIYLWTYDEEMNLLETNCPDADVISIFFDLEKTKTNIINYGNRHHKPIVMDNFINMIWLIVPEWRNEKLYRFYTLGPFFIDTLSEENLYSAIKQFHIDEIQSKSISTVLQNMPIISLHHALEYMIMLYYCVYEQIINISDFHYQEQQFSNQITSDKPTKKDIHGTYEMEQEMVRMVKEGNLEYKKHMNKIAVSGNIGQLSQSGDQIRQIKNIVLVCTVLFSRAAIEGGLSPEIAMTLTDHYFQSIEASKGISEVAEINATMQEDFVTRVHKCRNSHYSKAVQECCDYIDLHIDKPLSTKDIAENLNYSEIYLCRKFKSETGKTFMEYVQDRKIERAKDMMINDSLSIKEISEELGFCTLSYFGKIFKKKYGVSPSEWKKHHYCF